MCLRRVRLYARQRRWSRTAVRVSGRSEREHDDVMRAVATEPADFIGYTDWSAELDEPPSTDNFIVYGGKVYHKPEPRSLGRIGGFEL